MKKKILFVIPSLEGGGAERVIVNLLRNIDRTKFNVNFIAINLQGPYVKDLPNDINIIDLKKTRARYSIFKLIKEINKIKPDSILTTLGFINILLIIIKPFLFGKPRIVIREANTVSKNFSGTSNLKKSIYKSIYSYLYPKADVIIAQSEGMKNDLINFLSLPPNKIKRIYNPIDINTIISKSKEFNPFMHNGVQNIVSIGRLTYQKGFDILIEAFKVVVDHNPNTKLTILGEGPLKKELLDLADNLGIINNINFEGFKENPYPYLSNSDVFVLSSRWEGFPNVLLEALACGSNIVSTNCKSGPSEIIGDNKYGLLVEEENAELLAQNIINMLKKAPQTKQNMDQSLIYDIKNIVTQYEDILI
ncbi:glycosyltransferase [Neobacillus drentensis]|uniref:glycosyltransferase n=1 Tax=Neobacillus drentensis TaxID=220684 RepID=UPI0030026D40